MTTKEKVFAMTEKNHNFTLVSASGVFVIEIYDEYDKKEMEIVNWLEDNTKLVASDIGYSVYELDDGAIIEVDDMSD